jgi:hypothetical protein
MHQQLHQKQHKPHLRVQHLPRWEAPQLRPLSQLELRPKLLLE